MLFCCGHIIILVNSYEYLLHQFVQLTLRQSYDYLHVNDITQKDRKLMSNHNKTQQGDNHLLIS